MILKAYSANACTEYTINPFLLTATRTIAINFATEHFSNLSYEKERRSLESIQIVCVLKQINRRTFYTAVVSHYLD
jgi:hypothetical protein